MVADMAKLERVRQWVEDEFVRNPAETPFSVGIGMVEKDGRETGEVGVIVKVESKVSARALRKDDYHPLPTEIDGVRIDVQQAPVPTDQRLRTDTVAVQTLLEPQNTAKHRSCMGCPILGGAQVAPARPWVGTLGGAVRWKKPDGSYAYGAVTNAHVTGMNAEGQPMYQPSGGQGDWFGKVHKVVDLHFDGRTANGIDAAVIDCFRPKDAKYAGKLGGTVIPEQIDLGRIKPEPVRATLRMETRKTGRTTGTVDGRCVQINNTTAVRYDEGTALFRGQDVFREPNGGQFSAGGDSGSLILTRDNRPVSLLFAGGGLDTIGCPIEWVLQYFNAEFY